MQSKTQIGTTRKSIHKLLQTAACFGLSGCFGLLAISSSAMAQGSTMHQWQVDKARNNCWPHPFRGMDAISTQAPFEVMKANGWRLFNTVGGAMFTEECALTDAGRSKIEWIVTQAPEQRRAIFVKKAGTEADTASRIEAVQLAVSEMVPVGPLPEIQPTDIEPPLSSGQYQTVVNRALINSTPRPRLGSFRGLNTPGTSSSAGGSGGGSSGGGSSGSSGR